MLLAIHKRHCDVAHDLLMSLMADHVSEVSTFTARWDSGLVAVVDCSVA